MRDWKALVAISTGIEFFSLLHSFFRRLSISLSNSCEEDWRKAMIKNRKTVHVGNIEVTPFSAKKLKSINRAIKRKYDRLRKRYKEVRGRRVDWIDHHFEDGWLYVGVQFMDGTYFSLQFTPQIETEGIEFSDMSSGDDVILKEYYRRRREH